MNNDGNTRRFDSAETIKVRRFDRGGELLRVHRRKSDGAILAEGVAVREGILIYRNADGTKTRELVTRQAVLDTARTIARAALTLNHPVEGFVTADNFEDLGVGDVDGETRVEEDQGGFARAIVKIAIRRKDAIEAFDEGVQQLSPGYVVEIDPTPGIDPRFGRYDVSQIHREGNHLAMVPRGRGGPEVSLRADSDDAVHIETVPIPEPETGNDTSNRKDNMDLDPTLVALLALLGTRADNAEQALTNGGKIIAKLKADAAKAEDLDKAEEERDKAKEDLHKAEGERDAANLKADGLETAEQARSDAAELEKLQGLATALKVDHEGVELTNLRRAIAKTRIDDLAEDATDGYIDGVIGSIAADVKNRADKKPSRWDFDPKRKRADGDADNQTHEDKAFEDEYSNPYLDAAAEARASTEVTHGR